jgi:4-oxalomesaconate hydratase
MATKPLRVLIVAAHPADAFDQAGGTLAHHAAEGDKVSALIVTGGASSHDWQMQDCHKKADKSFNLEKEAEKASGSKTDEVTEACGLLGINDLHFLGLEDDAELLTQDMIFQIAEKFQEIRPNIVITHHPYEEGGFKLHASVGRATMYARRVCEGSGRLKGKPHRVAVTYFMSPMVYVNHNSLNQGVGFFRSDLYVDISDVIEKKIAAMDCIDSQYYSGIYSRKAAEIGDGSFGNIAGVPYAEQFQRYRPPVCYKLPVSDFELCCAEETREQMMARRGYMLDHRASLPEGQRHIPAYVLRRDLYEP